MKKTKNVLIIGYGVVGQAMHSIIIEDEKCALSIHDPYKKLITNLYDQDIVFICLPTPFNDIDISVIKEYLELYKYNSFKGLIVIKSNVIYDKISEYFNYLNIVINPEFLNQNTSFEDALKQEVVLIGGDFKNSRILIDFYLDNTLLNNDTLKVELCGAKEASEFKYIRNIYGAYKVLFWEFVQNTTGNARKMAELYHKMPYQSEMSQVSMDGYRGFGGACFPKDVKAFDSHYLDKLTQFMLEYNCNLQNNK